MRMREFLLMTSIILLPFLTELYHSFIFCNLIKLFWLFCHILWKHSYYSKKLYTWIMLWVLVVKHEGADLDAWEAGTKLKSCIPTSSSSPSTLWQSINSRPDIVLGFNHHLDVFHFLYSSKNQGRFSAWFWWITDGSIFCFNFKDWAFLIAPFQFFLWFLFLFYFGGGGVAKRFKFSSCFSYLAHKGLACHIYIYLMPISVPALACFQGAFPSYESEELASHF